VSLSESPLGFLSGALLPNAGLVGEPNVNAVITVNSAEVYNSNTSSPEGNFQVSAGDTISVQFSNPDYLDKVFEIISMYISDSAVIQQPTNQSLSDGSYRFELAFKSFSLASPEWQYLDEGDSEWSPFAQGSGISIGIEEYSISSSSSSCSLLEPPSATVDVHYGVEYGTVTTVTLSQVQGAQGYIFMFEGVIHEPDRVGPALFSLEGYPDIMEGQYQFFTDFTDQNFLVASYNSCGAGLFGDSILVQGSAPSLRSLSDVSAMDVILAPKSFVSNITINQEAMVPGRQIRVKVGEDGVVSNVVNVPCEEVPFPEGTCIDKYYMNRNSAGPGPCGFVCRNPPDCTCPEYPCDNNGFPPGACIDKYYLDTTAKFSEVGNPCPAICREPPDCDCSSSSSSSSAGDSGRQFLGDGFIFPLQSESDEGHYFGGNSGIKVTSTDSVQIEFNPVINANGTPFVMVVVVKSQKPETTIRIEATREYIGQPFSLGCGGDFYDSVFLEGTVEL
jgi:hypothetical protein